MGTLEGKAAIVLGASKAGNMGQVIAKRFRDEGARVLVAGRDEAEVERFARAEGMEGIACDITDKARIRAMADKALASFGKIDIAVNAAGWAQSRPFLDVDDALLDQVIAIQFKGPFQFFQVMLEAMGKGGGGSLIQISSATATIMTQDYAPYMGTKAGIDHVIRAIANEFGDKGIRANSISPGLTETPMTEAVFKVPGIAEAFAASYPLGRVGTSEDIAAAAVWLAGDECFMTGENLMVNGGLKLRGNPTAAVRAMYVERAATGVVTV
ncbi:MAG: SDR family oxidoreductase [Novosphingobium sp.]